MGRVCEASGNANPKGQSYLPRCPPLGKNIFQKYTSGCWCGADEDFTSANTNLAIGPDVKVPATTGAAVLAANDFATEANYCVTAGATGVVCLKGEQCLAGPKCKLPDGTEVTRQQQKYAWMLPKIKENGEFKTVICSSTNLKSRQCDDNRHGSEWKQADLQGRVE